jgi:hypothetical protein
MTLTQDKALKKAVGSDYGTYLWDLLEFPPPNSRDLFDDGYE